MQPFFHKYSLLGAVCLAAAALTSCRTIFERGEEGVAAVKVFPWNDWKPTALPEEYAIIRDRLFFLMPSLKYNWAYFRRASLYNRFALGVSYQHLRTDSRDLPALVQTDLHDWHLAIHITFIGLDFGAGPLHGFCEFGVGANGFLTAGLSYRF